MLSFSSFPFRTVLSRTALSALALGAAATAHAEAIYGLTSGGALVRFDSATPGTTTTSATITGLQSGTSLVGIDVRPSTGVLYGLGSNAALYTLNGSTGAATFIGSLSTGTIGSVVGIDFNPVPDLAGAASLRITTNAAVGNNLRANVNTGMIGTTVVDGDIGSPAGFLSGIAYTNNDRDPATGTALYGIRGGNLYQVTNPNAGTNTLIGSLGVSGLAGDLVGFDVSGMSGASFAALSLTTGTGFYSVNLVTGAATLIGAAVGNLIDITALHPGVLVTAVPEPETYAMMLLGLAGMGWVARRRRR